MKSTLSEIFKSLSLTVWAPIRLQKSVRGVSGQDTTLHVVILEAGKLFEPGLKFDEKSIEKSLEVQQLFVVCIFWGGCHPRKECTWQIFLLFKCPKNTLARRSQAVSFRTEVS